MSVQDKGQLIEEGLSKTVDTDDDENDAGFSEVREPDRSELEIDFDEKEKDKKSRNEPGFLSGITSVVKAKMLSKKAKNSIAPNIQIMKGVESPPLMIE